MLDQNQKLNQKKIKKNHHLQAKATKMTLKNSKIAQLLITTNF